MMGWAGGSSVAIAIIESDGVQMLEDCLRKPVLEGVLDALEGADWDTVDEAMGIDPVFDEIVLERHPNWFDSDE
jgi:hypothetical protein